MARDCVSHHRAMIHDRGGVRRLFDISDIDVVSWGRTLDGKSSATITIGRRNCHRQLGTLENIRSRRHELVIYRGDDRVWEGPIDDVAWTPEGVKLTAFDVKHYLDGTPLTKAWPNSEGGGHVYMTHRIEEILNYELTTYYTYVTGTGANLTVRSAPRWETVSPPANVLPHLDIRHGTVLTTVNTEPFQMSLGEHLDRLGESGMDWTVIGRKLLIWDSANPIGRTPTLIEADFIGSPEVYESGSDYASIAHVTADGDEGLVIGSDGQTNDYYGPWTHLASSQSEEGDSGPSQTQLNSQAYRQLLWRRRMPLEIVVPSGVGINLSEKLTLAHLVPGVEVPVRATLNLREVSQMQRLTEVNVSENAGGEDISITLAPAGDAEEAA